MVADKVNLNKAVTEAFMKKNKANLDKAIGSPILTIKTN